MTPDEVPDELAQEVKLEIYKRMPYGVGGASVMLLADQMARSALARVLPEIQAQALRDHRRRVARFYPAALVSKATVLADLDDYAARLTTTTEEPT